MVPNKAFKAMRKGLKMTQSALADSLSVTQATITDIERGKIKVSDNVKEKLKEKLNVDYEKIQVSDDLKTLESGENEDEKFRGQIQGSFRGLAKTIETGRKSIQSAIAEDNEMSKKWAKAAASQQKMLLELAQERPDIYGLFQLIIKQSQLEDFLIALTYSLHLPFNNQLVTADRYYADGRFDYARYKADFIEHYEKMMYIKPALDQLLNAAENLYKVVAEQSQDGDLKEFLPEYESHIKEITNEQ